MLLICVTAAASSGYAQKNAAKSPVKFGKVTPADFDLSASKFDTAADAVVVADIGSSVIEGNSKGWFSIQFRHFRRMKILNKKGFEAATVEIPLYTSGDATEKVDGLKAVTYNLENGKVVETRLDGASVFTEKVNKHLIQKKFTFPALKEGSVIEYEYTQYSDFLTNLQPWEFQGEYPCLWSEYEVSIPNFLQYVTLSQGYLPFDVNTSNSTNTNFRVTIPGGAGRDEQVSFDDMVADHRWVIKNVPALKEEPFTTTVENYISKIEFQLSRYAFPNSMTKDIMGNWVTTSKELMKEDDFGADLSSGNGWLDEDMKAITKGAAEQGEKAQKIFAFVRDNFTCTSRGSFYSSAPIKTVFKNKNGDAAGLNLLLVAMLNHEHIRAEPVILSTRNHGFTHDFYPLITRFNYVVARALIDSSWQYLDASSRWNSYGRLPAYCYNGHARVIDPESPEPVYFLADSLKEASLTTVFMNSEGKGMLSGTCKVMPGYYGSQTCREKLHDKGEKDFFKSIQQGIGSEVELSNTSIDSLKQVDMPVAINYDFKIKSDSTEDIIYFNPMLIDAVKENPFKAADRQYPVEMSFVRDETYVLNMEIPQGYTVDEMPKSAKVLFNEDEGSFEYLMVKNEDQIQFRCRLQLKKANYKREDYATLRDFFAFVVKKENEQIVFKKKSS